MLVHMKEKNIFDNLDLDLKSSINLSLLCQHHINTQMTAKWSYSFTTSFMHV